MIHFSKFVLKVFTTRVYSTPVWIGYKGWTDPEFKTLKLRLDPFVLLSTLETHVEQWAS